MRAGLDEGIRADQVGQIQRMTLQRQALDRMNSELFPVARDLRCKLGILKPASAAAQVFLG